MRIMNNKREKLCYNKIIKKGIGAVKMSQQTFSDFEYSNRKKKTKREEFLDVMEEIIPWDEWVEFVKPYYPSGKRGRPTKGIEKYLEKH